MPKIGVALTTLNRRETFTQCVHAYRKYTPKDFPFVVVDDGSTEPVPEIRGATVIRNNSPRGIAFAKNQSVSALMDAGCDWLLLSDDDCWPTAPNYWVPFTESGQLHTLYQPTALRRCDGCNQDTVHVYDTITGRFACPDCVDTVTPLHRDHRLFSVQWGAGVFYCVHRSVIERVGGLRPQFQRWSCETWEWSHRIHNAGLTAHPFQSPHSPDLYAMDAHTTGRRSSVPEPVRNAHRERNWKLFQQFKDTDDYVPYREPRITDNVTICIPRRDTPDRVDAHNRCYRFWKDAGFNISVADSDPGKPFNCSTARNNAVRQATTAVVAVVDADTIIDPTQIARAVDMVTSGAADLVYPFTTYRHVDKAWALKPGDAYKTAPAQQTYSDSPGGGFVLTTRTWERFGGFDERFTAGLSPSGSCWGYDDTAFRVVASTLGTVKRVPGTAISFNHATVDGRPDRDFGDTNPNRERFSLYEQAHGNPERMAELIK